MDSLLDQLRAAIDEDERIALAVRHEEWTEAVEPGHMNEYDEPEHNHITRHAPARVLRQVAAHQKILELHQIDYTAFRYNIYGEPQRAGWVCSVCSECVDGEPQRGDGPACPTVVLLAEAYGIEVHDG